VRSVDDDGRRTGNRAFDDRSDDQRDGGRGAMKSGRESRYPAERTRVRRIKLVCQRFMQER
jgi:hypothetical protein